MDMYDEYYATVCPTCKENSVDEYEDKCTSCMLDEFATLYSSELENESEYV